MTILIYINIKNFHKLFIENYKIGIPKFADLFLNKKIRFIVSGKNYQFKTIPKHIKNKIHLRLI